MPDRYSIIEPHPSVPRNGAYLAGGRGGAGNYRRYTAHELTPGPTASGPASRSGFSSRPFGKRATNVYTSAVPPSTSNPQARSNSTSVVASTGIGGAGNMFARAETEERVFQFDEELMKRRDTASTPVYHIGRGGGGNWIDESSTVRPFAAPVEGKPRVARLGSTSSDASSESSGASLDSDRGQVRRKVEGALDRLRNRLAA